MSRRTPGRRCPKDRLQGASSGGAAAHCSAGCFASLRAERRPGGPAAEHPAGEIQCGWTFEMAHAMPVARIASVEPLRRPSATGYFVGTRITAAAGLGPSVHTGSASGGMRSVQIRHSIPRSRMTLSASGDGQELRISAVRS